MAARKKAPPRPSSSTTRRDRHSAKLTLELGRVNGAIARYRGQLERSRSGSAHARQLGARMRKATAERDAVLAAIAKLGRERATETRRSRTTSTSSSPAKRSSSPASNPLYSAGPSATAQLLEVQRREHSVRQALQLRPGSTVLQAQLDQLQRRRLELERDVEAPTSSRSSRRSTSSAAGGRRLSNKGGSSRTVRQPPSTSSSSTSPAIDSSVDALAAWAGAIKAAGRSSSSSARVVETRPLELGGKHGRALLELRYMQKAQTGRARPQLIAGSSSSSSAAWFGPYWYAVKREGKRVVWAYVGKILDVGKARRRLIDKLR